MTVGIIVGITATVGLILITQAMRQDLRDKLGKFAANIIITPKKDELSLTYGSVTLPGLKLKNKNYIDHSYISRFKMLKGLGVLSPKVVGSTIVNKEKQKPGLAGGNVLLIGAIFENEKTLKSWWEIKGKIPSFSNEVIVGSSVASRLGLKTGSKIRLSGSLYKISAVLKETGASDDSAVFMVLSEAQKILGLKNKVSLIEANTVNSSFSAKEVAEKISSEFPVAQASAVQSALQAQSANVNFFSWFSLASSVITLFVSSLIVFITMMSSVNERVREIGIFRAVGFRGKHIITVIMAEAITISFAGGLAGTLFGYVFARTALPFFVKGLKHVPFSLLILPSAVLLAIALSCISSFLPAKKASKLDPAEALRFI